MRQAGTVALLVLALLAPASALADPTPIPQNDTDTQYIGNPATPNPISSPDPPRHPHMAPNALSNLHVDAYQTDANQGPGPLGVSPQVISTFYSNVCGSITFDSKGRIVTVCVGLAGPTLRMLDPKTLDELASFRLPPRGPPNPARPSPFNDFGGGGYFYLDDQDRAVLPTTNGHIYVVKETDGAGFALEHDYDLSALTPFPEKIFSALPDWSGRLWFVTTGGEVGFVDPQTGGAQAFDTNEEIANSFAIDELGGVYLVTDKALYRFGVGADGKPAVTWRAEYPNSGIAKPGQVDAGSGTTPTITPRGFVAITDNADPMDVVLYDRRDGRQICSVPVFDKGASASDNSLVSFNDALIVENNYGYTGPPATEQGKSTTPGVDRVDYDPATGGCNLTWHSDEISPTVVPKVSLANGLLYLWTKPAGDGADPWYLTALDARTGKLVYKQLAGTGLGFNNNYAPVTLGPDGTLYQGVLGGMVAIRDAVPPPGAAPPTAAAPSGCRLLPGPSARPRGRDLRLIPNGLSDVTVTRLAARHGFVRSRRVTTKAGVRAPRTLRGRGLRDGTYVVEFRSGTSEIRRVVVTRRHGRFRRGSGPIDLAAGCGRASLSAPLFGRGGLTVRISSVDTAGAVGLVATRIGRRHRGVRPDRVGGQSPLTARLRLAPGTWRVAISIHGRRLGTLVARRPR